MRGRSFALLPATVLVLALVTNISPPAASALTSPVKVLSLPASQDLPFSNDSFLAYTTNSRAHPYGYNAYVYRYSNGHRLRINAPGTHGLSGNFDPGTNTLIYEQYRPDRADLVTYNLDTKRRHRLATLTTHDSTRTLGSRARSSRTCATSRRPGVGGPGSSSSNAPPAIAGRLRSNERRPPIGSTTAPWRSATRPGTSVRATFRAASRSYEDAPSMYTTLRRGARRRFRRSTDDRSTEARSRRRTGSCSLSEQGVLAAVASPSTRCRLLPSARSPRRWARSPEGSIPTSLRRSP